MIHRRLIAIVLILYSGGSVVLAQNPGFAGRDRSICPSGYTTIGSPSTCTGCCYVWSPQAGLDDPTKPNPTVSGISVSTNYAVTISDPDGNYTTDDVNVTVYESDLQVWHPNYHLFNTMLDPSQEKLPGVQSFVNWDNDDCDMDFDLEDDEVLGGDNELIKLRVLMTVQLLQRPGRGEKDLNKGPGEYIATLDLADGTQLSGLRFWKSNDKAAGEFSLGDALVLTEVFGSLNQYEAYLWIEGTEGHTDQQQVKLFARAIDDVTPACRDGFAAVTIVDIESMEWIGINNGYTGNGKNNLNVLDNCPTNGTGQRVFPEGKTTNAKIPAKTGVKLKVSLSVKPPVKHRLYLRTFDVDDPSNEVAFVDPNDAGVAGAYAGADTTTSTRYYTEDNDNRGLVIQPTPNVSSGTISPVLGFKEGIFVGSSVVRLNPYTDTYKILDASKKEFELDTFLVSQMCGDNYKIAISNDSLFIKNMRNRDKYDQGNIVNSCTLTPLGASSIAANLCSPMLTVWRTLHIEYDRMMNPNWYDNGIVRGYFKNFGDPSNPNLNATSSLKAIFCDSIDYNIMPGTQFNENAPLQDASTVVPASSNHRRFADVGVRLFNPPVEFCRPNTNGSGSSSLVQGNNQSSTINFISPQNITSFIDPNGIARQLRCRITDTMTPPNMHDFNVYNISPISGGYKIESNTAIPNLLTYYSGSISLGGGPVEMNAILTIDSTGKSFTIQKSALKIPIEVRDDDNIPIVGRSNDIVAVDFTTTQNAYKPVYIDIVNDGGGVAANSQIDMKFYRNIKVGPDSLDDKYSLSYLNIYTDGNYHQTFGKSHDNYWIMYALSGWQFRTPDDADCEHEGAVLGAAFGATTEDCSITKGGDFLLIAHSAAQEALLINPSYNLGHTIAHEIGHCLGLSHGNNYNPLSAVPATCLGGIASMTAMRLMAEGIYSNPTDIGLIPYHINLLRSRTVSPKIKQ